MEYVLFNNPFFLSLAYAGGKVLLDMVRKNGKKILTQSDIVTHNNIY